ncbi:MAG TPA: JAB domain-containing protein [Rhizomicrobium sp.]|jgi:DNA repair protein RadC
MFAPRAPLRMTMPGAQMQSITMMAREITAAAKALHIPIHDHLVIGRGGHVSFKSLGLL